MAQEPTRERIVACALQLFAERGFRGTSVAQIEKAAGLSPGSGSLYAHFRNKQEVLDAAIEHAMSAAESGFSLLPLLPLGDLRAELTLVARATLLMLNSARNLLLVLIKEVDQSPEFAGNVRRSVIDRAHLWFSDWLNDKAEAGEIADLDFPVVTSIYTGALIQYWVMDDILGGPPQDVDEDRFIAGWVDSFHRVLTPREA
jgi:AcrR family transcriptional regulator